jgi:hypothetical protein
MSKGKKPVGFPGRLGRTEDLFFTPPCNEPRVSLYVEQKNRRCRKPVLYYMIAAIAPALLPLGVGHR